MADKSCRCIVALSDIRSFGPLFKSMTACGIEALAVAHSAPEALAHIEALLPDGLIADLILPGSDGLSLAREVFSRPLNRYPGVILLDPARCTPEISEELASLGVRVLSKPVSDEALSMALASLQAENRCLSKAMTVKLTEMLDGLGIPNHPGRQYLIDAVALTWMDRTFLNNLKKRLYAAIALKHSTDADRVERALRHGIDVAWRTGDIAFQHRMFGDTIDAKRGKPTCGEMIARLADILRWEGSI